MVRLQSYVLGAWHEGAAPFRSLIDPATEEVVAETSTSGIDYAAVMNHAREVGGPALRAMTFAERGAALKAISKALYAKREWLIEVAMANGGNTRGDAKFDVDGATGTLSYYAYLGKTLGDRTYLTDGDSEALIPGNARFHGLHIRVPKRGVAVHVNAFNFPAWGTFEKAAVALLAGVPVVSKPATATAWLAYEMTKIVVESGVLPAGAFQFIGGSCGDLLDNLTGQDILAFTGSANTAATLRAGKGPVSASTAVNIEADSLNSAVLGPDVQRGDDLYHWFINSVRLEMTQKAGQKCTAIRRVFVPEGMAEAVIEDLSEELGRIVIGDPRADGVRMGPLSDMSQLDDYREGVGQLAQEAAIVYGSPTEVEARGATPGKGAFVSPVLLHCTDPHGAEHVHAREVFGPVATVMPYDGTAGDVGALVARGGGSLVSSVATSDKKFLQALALDAAAWNGRLLLVDKKVSDTVTPHGMVLPSCVHGGPGRAGGGEELGGLRGLDLYLQRSALQGNVALLNKLFA
ncbi:MAG: 3,4-dehydroadipyl-CoA semialdehyde dehydrogenase [Proteobacteria bacterium]|nr:3,4-dehydroadipyl-CoA semialdehyde dehydrogenase [Pseudomonadota bacterium]MCP4919933.1 3,4-dehydroadipyl-CoA semialdehyde dehydrogenase [Pseudomonadota bacterium]